jgi:hypothetical protein
VASRHQRLVAPAAPPAPATTLFLYNKNIFIYSGDLDNWDEWRNGEAAWVSQLGTACWVSQVAAECREQWGGRLAGTPRCCECYDNNICD